ncbi:MAG: DUF2283 domain-containing protein [Sulfolobales archaeon]
MSSETEFKRRYYIEDLEKIWIEYDRQSDTLYIHTGAEEEPDETILVGEDLIVSLRQDKIITITIINFSKRAGLEY